MSASKMIVDEGILLYAVRYTLGRQTYAPHDVIDAIRANLPSISINMQKLMVRGITYAERYDGLGNINIDKPAWLRLREDLISNVSAEAW